MTIARGRFVTSEDRSDQSRRAGTARRLPSLVSIDLRVFASAAPAGCSVQPSAFEAKSGRSPTATESLSLCVLKEKVTKEKEHPAWRLPGILPGKSVSRGRAFRQGILPWRKGIGIHADARYAAYRPRLTAAQGPRVEQRAIVARTFQKSQSKAGAARRPLPSLFNFLVPVSSFRFPGPLRLT